MSRDGDHTGGGLVAMGRSPALITDPIVRSLVFILAVSAVFLTFPGIDLWFSRLFYDPAMGFPMSRLGAFTGLRTIGDWSVGLASAVLVVAVVVKLELPWRPTAIPPGKILFLLATLALGPGLVVNAILKATWGRPRPTMVDVFGGEATFVEIWRISDLCASNCSFVSGEASSAIWLVGLAVLTPPSWRSAVVKALLVLAALLSLNRVAFGGHFLSDVLLSWGLTLFIMAVVHRYTIDRPPSWLDNDSLERRLARLGNRIGRRRTS